MCVARKVALLMTAVFAGAALSAGAAHAQETEVVVKTEAGAVCNPCTIHLAGESSIFFNSIEVSRCRDEFSVRIFSNGTGEAEWAGTARGAPGCNVVNCSSPERHWPIDPMGEYAASVVHLNVRFCLNNAHCSGEVTVTEPNTHRYSASMNQTCPTGLRVTGGWLVEGNPIEIDHAF